MKSSALVRLAPIMLLAMLGTTVCFLVACGELSEDAGSSEDAICSSSSSSGYGGYGYGNCTNGYGYGSSGSSTSGSSGSSGN